MLAQVLSTVAPIVAIVALGYAGGRLGMRFDAETIGGLVLKFGTPALVFSALMTNGSDPAVVTRMAVAAASVTAACALIGILVLKAAGLPLHTYLPPMLSGNSSNMGLPVCALAFGDAGLALAIGYLLTIMVSQHTLGYAITAGRFSFRILARQPVVYVIPAVALLLKMEAQVPAWITQTAALLGGLVIPGMLLLLGDALAKLKVIDLRLGVGMSLLRLGAGTVAASAVIAAFGFDGHEAGVVFLMAAMPVPIINMVFAQWFGRSPEIIASVIVVSTTLTLCLLPALVALALRIDAFL